MSIRLENLFAENGEWLPLCGDVMKGPEPIFPVPSRIIHSIVFLANNTYFVPHRHNQVYDFISAILVAIVEIEGIDLLSWRFSG